MAGLLSDNALDDPTTANAAAPTDTSTSSGGSAAQGGTGTANPLAPTSNSAPSPTGINSQAANQDDTKAITSLNQNVDFSPLINYVGNQGKQATNAINSANTSFTNNLGGGLGTFGQPQQDTLDSVIQGKSPLSSGQSMLANTYGGPTGFDPSSYNPLVSQYQTSAGELGTTPGISTLLQQMNPQLSAGEQNFDALNYMGNDAYKAASQGVMNDANVVSNNGTATNANALAAIAQRQSDIGAFNTAGTGFVTSRQDALTQALKNQMQQANQADTATQQEMNALAGGAPIGNYGTGNLTFDPNQYQMQNVHSNVGGDFVTQNVNPYSYLNYTGGQMPTQSNVATQDQATQYDNIEKLLNGFGSLTPSARTAGSLGINNSAFQQALLAAQSQRNTSDAAWMAAHQAPVAAAAAPAVVADNSSGGSGTEGGGAGDGGTGGGDAGAGDGGGGGDSFHKGGLVKPSLQYSTKKSNLNQIQTPQGIMPPAEQQSLTAKQGASSAPNLNVTQVGPAPAAFQKGGYIKPGTSPNPRIRDDIPARVDDGEFVVNRAAVNTVGPKTMMAINNIHKLPPAHQLALTKSLHAALSKALQR